MAHSTTAAALPAGQQRSGFLAWLMAPERRGPLLVTPAIAMLVVMNIFPLLWSLGLSFFNYRANRLDAPSIVWLRNFERVLTDDTVWERFQTTAVIVGSSVLLQLIIGFLLALLFERAFPLRRILLMLVLTPMMLSFVAVGVFFKLFYEPTFGLVSQFISIFTGQPFVVLGTPAGALTGIIIADAWMWSPFVMLLVLAGLVSVPKYLYEAAEIDRASWWRRFRTITFPYIKGLLLLAILFAWLVARSMARSLRELRHGALTVAQYGLPQAVARLREPSLAIQASPDQIAKQIAEPLPVRSRDEFGQVTEAFNAVHLEAVAQADVDRQVVRRARGIDVDRLAGERVFGVAAGEGPVLRVDGAGRGDAAVDGLLRVDRQGGA